MTITNALDNDGIGYLLKRAQHALRLAFDVALRPLNLTTPQYAVLSVIEEKPGISNANLAKLSFVTAQTMHGIISNLEKRGLVERSSSAEHGRILSTKLTKSGKQLLNQAKKAVTHTEKQLTSHFKEKDILLLKKLLKECIEYSA